MRCQGHDSISRREVRNPLADGVDRTRHGIAHDVGADGVFPCVACPHLGATADERTYRLDAHFAGRRLRQRRLLDNEVVFAFRLGQSFQLFPPLTATYRVAVLVPHEN